MKFCVIIPVYNSENHIAGVIQSVLPYSDTVIVVNDGSTDTTAAKLSCFLTIEAFRLISYPQNHGKGYALQQGFKKAIEFGFTHAITMDADGQHLATDITVLQQKAQENPEALIVGSRRFDIPNMPESSKFANNFSNFWFTVQTGQQLPDTQTGFRIYPLEKMGRMKLFATRYEAELELLVRCAWKNIKLVSQAINVYYPPKNERLSHFRGTKDFFRISVLNTVLCFLAVVYGYPRMLVHRIIKK